jgi:hypothetical protein
VKVKSSGKKIQLKSTLTFDMATAGITEEAIQQMIQDAVAAALAAQAATHRQDMDAQAARLQRPSSSAAPSSPASSTASSTRSTVP